MLQLILNTMDEILFITYTTNTIQNHIQIPLSLIGD